MELQESYIGILESMLATLRDLDDGEKISLELLGGSDIPSVYAEVECGDGFYPGSRHTSIQDDLAEGLDWINSQRSDAG